MEIEEEFISGFCRTSGAAWSVCCEYTVEDGKKILSFMDCAYKKCLNQGACEIYRQAVNGQVLE